MGRIVRVGSGSALVVAGLAMLVLPGPGLLTIAGGLTLLRRALRPASPDEPRP